MLSFAIPLAQHLFSSHVRFVTFFSDGAVVLQVFAFADKYRGPYSNGLRSAVCPFYCSYSGYQVFSLSLSLSGFCLALSHLHFSRWTRTWGSLAVSLRILSIALSLCTFFRCPCYWQFGSGFCHHLSLCTTSSRWTWSIGYCPFLPLSLLAPGVWVFIWLSLSSFACDSLKLLMA